MVCLAHDAADRNKLELVNSGIFEPLVKLLLSAVPSLRQQASLCLSTLLSHTEARQALQKSNLSYWEPLLALLSPEMNAVAHENAWYHQSFNLFSPSSVILDRLCCEYCSRIDTIKHGFLPQIVHMLSSPSPEVKRAAVRLLLKLLDEYETRSAMVTLNGAYIISMIIHTTPNNKDDLKLRDL
jgi:hypothetical protein